jgi:hypothetical protein
VEGKLEARTGQTAPNIIEIGAVPYMWEVFPGTTEFYSSWLDETTRAPERGRHVVSLATLPRLFRRLADPSVDLIVVHAPAYSPWGIRALVRTFFRRRVLGGSIPALRGIGTELLRLPAAAPIVVLDFEDSTTIARGNLFLLDKAVLYFKRELPADHWAAFAGTAHWRVPTPRFRADTRNRARVAKLRPISLGLPLNVARRAAALDARLDAGRAAADGAKNIDVFFAGRIRDSSTVRERGLAELLALRQEGYAIDVSDAALPLDEYLARCARAHLVWSPEGFGWQCFRTYEAAICGAAPLCSRPGIECYRPLIEGAHAVYYDVEPGGLTRAVRTALADHDRLRAIAAAAREHVQAFHTPAAIARHIVDAAGRRPWLTP